ncbi:MAG: hypothetical protein ACJ8CR_39540 [Roseiflexaceae bacterium]
MKPFALIFAAAALLLSFVGMAGPSLASPSNPPPTTVPIVDGTVTPGQQPPKVVSRDKIPPKDDVSAPNRPGVGPSFVSSYALYTNRVFFYPYKGYGKYYFSDWRINRNSKVLASISETSGLRGPRFVGAAPIRIESVAPGAGYVVISFSIQWGSPLPYAIDYLIVNA